uniref:Uncharacterized protein n=1 Tax=viral metagenome TaxID=1070528 RepID=A0A6C0LSG2_9ZZZZ
MVPTNSNVNTIELKTIINIEQELINRLNKGDIIDIEILIVKIHNKCILNIGLIIAASKGYLNVIILLIKYGADIHHENDAALRISSICIQINVVRFLIENGAIVSAKENFAIKNVIKMASIAKSTELSEIIKLLLNNGANLDKNPPCKYHRSKKIY